MPFKKFTMARADLAVAVAFMVVAALIIQQGVKLGPGWGDSGPEPGFFPFSLAMLMGLGGLAIVIQGVIHGVRRTASSAFFEDREEITELFRVGVPIAAAIAAVPVFGLYLMTALYTWLFSWWHGRFRWYSSVFAGVVIPVVMYAILDQGLRIPMPRSIWYGSLLPF